MSILKGAYGRIRELSLIFGVAVLVALGSTLAGSVFDKVHQVDAEQLAAREVAAVPAADGMQVLSIDHWGVRLTLPLAPELPLVSYANHDDASVGLSSADLKDRGVACQASRSALGSLIRFPEGSYKSLGGGGVIEYFAGTVDQYDYIYRMPQSSCSDKNFDTINRETSIISGSLDSLAPVQTKP